MRLFQYLVLLGASASVTALTGCTARAVGRPAGFRLIVFLDKTASIDAAQRAAWLKEATGLTRQLADLSQFAGNPQAKCIKLGKSDPKVFTTAKAGWRVCSRAAVGPARP